MTTATAISQAIAGVAKVWYLWLKSKDRNRMSAAIEAAENYIFANEKTGEYKSITDERKEKLLIHFRKRFFNYN